MSDMLHQRVPRHERVDNALKCRNPQCGMTVAMSLEHTTSTGCCKACGDEVFVTYDPHFDNDEMALD